VGAKHSSVLQGADPNVALGGSPDDWGSPPSDAETALGLAAMHGHSTDRCESVAALLAGPSWIDGFGASVDQASGGMTPLQISAWHGRSGVLRQLLEAGADHTARGGSDGETALALASRRGEKECIALLEAWATGTRDAVALDVVAKNARSWHHPISQWATDYLRDE
jgi:ankyrin repeat protein